MKRDLSDKLLAWKSSPARKPLIVKGARQVGKTHTTREFGQKHYRNIVECNFEKDKELASLFARNLNPESIISYLETYFKTRIEKENTLIFFDEIQECGEALTSLKYFQEDAPQYHLIAAGSFLGLALARNSSFPVGKVDFINLKPLSFYEFLEAAGHENLIPLINENPTDNPLPDLFHNQLTELLKIYFNVGGMPEAVKSYIGDTNIHNIRKIQSGIIESYENDFVKHAPASEVIKISAVWHNIDKMLSKERKKFMYAGIRQGARASDYESALQWLINAGLVIKSSRVNIPKLPLSAYYDQSFFKLYLHDVGLLAAKTHLPPELILHPDDIFREFNGALTENFTAQELSAATDIPLTFWTSKADAEIDFIIQKESLLCPLEIKSGFNPKAKSLTTYIRQYDPKIAYRCSLLNFNKSGKICNIPLYAIRRLIDNKSQAG